MKHGLRYISQGQYSFLCSSKPSKISKSSCVAPLRMHFPRPQQFWFLRNRLKGGSDRCLSPREPRPRDFGCYRSLHHNTKAFSLSLPIVAFPEMDELLRSGRAPKLVDIVWKIKNFWCCIFGKKKWLYNKKVYQDAVLSGKDKMWEEESFCTKIRMQHIQYYRAREYVERKEEREGRDGCASASFLSN